ncbi:MAG: UDP-N-acetylmuramoyl-tripeptide--D-alanyl-D-alanine ligase [Eubacteriales bacterium]
MNLRAADIAQALNARLIGDPNAVVNCVITDSRVIKENCLFIALRGQRVDGHDFIPAAFEEGASCALSEVEYIPPHGAVIIVEDTVKALLPLASWYRSTLSAKVVAVTGSVGKTTTKELCWHVLSQKLSTHKTTGNLNNTIGLPLTLLAAQASHGAIVAEMGMNSFGEIDLLSRTARPDIAVINNIGTSHIQNLGSREGIKKAKLEILSGMKDGHIVLNADEPLLWEERGRTGQNECFFGIENPEADVKAKDIQLHPYHSSFTVTYNGGEQAVKLNTPGIHNVYNALAAFTVGLICSVPPSLASIGLESYIPEGNRQNIYAFKEYTFIEDCYNASPESMEAALTVLRGLSATRRVAVLSDMLELGDYAPEAHTKLGESAVRHGIDLLFLYGSLSKHTRDGALSAGLDDESIIYAEKADLPSLIAQRIRSGDALLFKASHGMKMDGLINALKELLS